LLLCGLYFGCATAPRSAGEAPDQPDRVLVQSDIEYTLTSGEFFDFLTKNRYKLSGGTLEANEVRRVLDSLLIDTLSGFAADTVDLTKHRLAHRDYLHQYQDYLIKKWTDAEVFAKVSAYDSSEVLAFFAASPDRFHIKEQIKIYQILISGYGLLVGPDSVYYKNFTNVQLREKAREQIYQVYDLLKYGEAFQNMALAFNQDVRSRDNAGFVGWTTRGTYYDPFDSIAFHLKVGEFSTPYLDKDGWHIVYVDGHLPEGQLPIDTPGVFEHARQTLLSDKQVLRAYELTDSLRQGLQILFNEAIGDSNIYRVNDETWCGIINGRDTVKAYVLKYFEEGIKGKYKVDSTNRDQKLEILQLAADRYLTVAAMRERGLDRDSDVVAFQTGLWRSKTKQIVLNGQYDFDWIPSDPAIKAYYEEHIDEYVFGKPTTLQYMTVGDSTFANFLRDQAITGIELPDVLREFKSTNPGGVLSVSKVMTVGSTDIPFDIWQASVIAPTGGVSPLIKHGDSYVFVKAISRQESRNLALARGDILVKLQKEHQLRAFEKFRDNLFSRYGVKITGQVGAVTLQPYWIRNKKS
jgi:parvulin-like peptidyl-prolyl isomerase